MRGSAPGSAKMVRMDAPRNLLRVERPFWWGVLVVADRDWADDVPTELSESGFGTSETAIAVRVRHAQDVEFDDASPDVVVSPCEVVVTVNVGTPTSRTVFEHDVSIESGWLTVGDAESQDAVRVSPGRWQLSISLDDAEFVERVDLWLAKVEPAA